LGNNRLRVSSNSGDWEFTWIFTRDHAVISVDRADTSRQYWFLYEGPAAGAFDPASHYWGNDIDGMDTPAPDYLDTSYTGDWKWVYIGDKRLDRVFYLSMMERDSIPDFFAYFGNDPDKGMMSEDGMTVFGFGRVPRATPGINGRKRFLIGFYENRVTDAEGYGRIRSYITDKTKPFGDGMD
jgi:hypothetical protein